MYRCLAITVAVLAILPAHAWQLRTVAGVAKIASDQTIGADTHLIFADGGAFEIAAGKTLTINGSLQAPAQQIFTGAGKVVFGAGKVQRVVPQWWGARGDGEHDDTAALQAATDSLSRGGAVYLSPGEYANTGFTVKSNITFAGAGIGASVLRFTPTTGSCITLPKDCGWLRIEKLTFKSTTNGDTMAVNGAAEYVRHLTMRDFTIDGFKTGIYVAAGMNLRFDFGYIGCYGMGKANGTVGLKLGDKEKNKACTTTTIREIYFTNAETCFYNRAAPCNIVRPIFETCQIGLDSYTRVTVIAPFWAGNKKAAARLTDNGGLFIGTFHGEHKFIYADKTMQDRTSFIPDTFDSPMKLGLFEFSPKGEMNVRGQDRK